MNSRVQPGRSAGAASPPAKGGNPSDSSSREPATSGRNASGDVIADIKDAARSAGQTLKHQASDLGAEVGHEFEKTASVQKERGAEALRGFAGAMNAAADQMTTQSPTIARHIRDTASKVEAVSDNIAEKDVSDLLKSAAELAREQPAWFIGGAVAVGFGLTRFLMSNPQRIPKAEQDGAAAKRGSKAHGS